MIISIGCDHSALELKNELINPLLYANILSKINPVAVNGNIPGR
jgi:ribose 5-phosphate isomerase RpiB